MTVFAPAASTAIIYLVMIIVLLFRPQGLLGER
jgi:branched-chain amino acid transport system permease protein